MKEKKKSHEMCIKWVLVTVDKDIYHVTHIAVGVVFGARLYSVSVCCIMLYYHVSLYYYFLALFLRLFFFFLIKSEHLYSSLLQQYLVYYQKQRTTATDYTPRLNDNTSVWCACHFICMRVSASAIQCLCFLFSFCVCVCVLRT